MEIDCHAYTLKLMAMVAARLRINCFDATECTFKLWILLKNEVVYVMNVIELNCLVVSNSSVEISGRHFLDVSLF